MTNIFVSFWLKCLISTSARFVSVKLMTNCVIHDDETHLFIYLRASGQVENVDFVGSGPFPRLSYLMQYLLTRAMKSNCSIYSLLNLRRCKFVVA